MRTNSEDATGCIVMACIMMLVLIVGYALLDTVVQVGIIKHKNMTVQPASIMTAGVHQRARTGAAGKYSTARGAPSASTCADCAAGKYYDGTGANPGIHGLCSRQVL